MRSIVELVVSSSSSGSKIGALPVDHFMVKLYLESFSLIRSSPEFSMLCIAFMNGACGLYVPRNLADLSGRNHIFGMHAYRMARASRSTVA